MQQPKKILIVLYYYHPYVSGVSVCAKRVAEGLVEQGYEVTVLTSRFDKTLLKNEIINGVNIIRRPVGLKISKGVIMPTFLIDIVKLSFNFDYINFHLPMAETGLASLLIPKRKIITTYQCDIFLGGGPIQKLASWTFTLLMKIQLTRSKYVIPSTMDYMSNSKMSHYANKSVPIYPTVNEKDFYPINPKPLLDLLGVGDNVVLIGFVGRVVYEKGIQYLLEAIPLLSKELKDFKIIIGGDYEKIAGGSVKDQLDSIIKENPDKVVFTGYLSDIDRNRLYSAINVLVLPSIDPLEAFGLVQVEAMLCGTPVVASNLPGVREVVNITGYGKLCEPKRPEDIAKQITNVLEDPERYKPVRKNVVKYFSKRSTISAYTKLMT